MKKEPRTIEQMIGENEEFKELFRRSPHFNTSLYSLANGQDEVKIIAELSKFIMLQHIELEKKYRQLP